MNKRILAICDSEIAYCNRILSYLATHGFHQYTIMTFSSIERLAEYFSEEKDTIEILLIGEAVYQNAEILQKASKKIILQDKGTLEVEDIPAIKKYQSVPDLMKQVSELYAQDINCRGMSSFVNQKTKVYGFYTPGEGDISCICSALFAQIMAEQKKVMYLNLSTYASMKGLFLEQAETEEYDLGDLLYYLKQNEEKALYKIDAMKHSVNHLDYIEPIAYPEDLKEITMEDWNRLLSCLCYRSGYEAVVLCCGDSLKDLSGMLEACDAIITPLTQNRFSQERMRIFTKMCMERELEPLLEKMHQIAIEESGVAIRGCVSEVQYTHLGNQIRELVNGYHAECI